MEAHFRRFRWVWKWWWSGKNKPLWSFIFAFFTMVFIKGMSEIDYVRLLCADYFPSLSPLYLLQHKHLMFLLPPARVLRIRFAMCYSICPRYWVLHGPGIRAWRSRDLEVTPLWLPNCKGRWEFWGGGEEWRVGGGSQTSRNAASVSRGVCEAYLWGKKLTTDIKQEETSNDFKKRPHQSQQAGKQHVVSLTSGFWCWFRINIGVS